MSNNKFAPKALGTGIILSANGLILAHYHTVGEHSSIRVRLHNGTVRQASGSVKTGAQTWYFSISGDDCQRQIRFCRYPHDWSMGCILGGPSVQQSVSAGLVSNRSRPYPSPVESKLVRFVQSDVVIHPGSSEDPSLIRVGGLCHEFSHPRPWDVLFNSHHALAILETFSGG